MKLVIRKIGDKSPIYKIGNKNYDIKEGQEIVEVDNGQWEGLRKSEIHYDRSQGKIINTPYPETQAEIDERLKNQEIAEMKEKMPEIMVEVKNGKDIATAINDIMGG